MAKRDAKTQPRNVKKEKQVNYKEICQTYEELIDWKNERIKILMGLYRKYSTESLKYAFRMEDLEYTIARLKRERNGWFFLAAFLAVLHIIALFLR